MSIHYGRAKSRLSPGLRHIARTLGCSDLRLSSGGHYYLVFDSQALGCKVSIQHRRFDGEFVLFWPYAEVGQQGGRQERRTMVAADDVLALVRGKAADADPEFEASKAMHP